MTIKDLKPAEVFGIFDQITKVPRPSKKEGKSVSSYWTLPASTA